ncbi:TonB family protein [Raoultella sp. BIGb0149]|uniref:TonB family protein n=1 Tax=Raoultella sp. BIGb0149 TaxID=2485116 RepID=UPI00105DA543|nr:TonB family protein [Raoultella sp. BIGb0149]
MILITNQIIIKGGVMIKKWPILLVLFLSACFHKSNPVAVERPVPDYPVKAYKEGAAGYVKLKYDVNSDGSVSNIMVIESSPPGYFEDAVIGAVKRWRFEKGNQRRGIPLVIRFNPTGDIRPPSGPCIQQSNGQCTLYKEARVSF